MKLGDCLRIKHGYAFKSKFFAPTGSHLVLTPGNFRPEGGLKFDGQQKYYTGEFSHEFILRKGDFLVVMTDLTQNAPILGSPAFIPEDNKYLHNQRLGKIINIDESQLGRHFLFYLLNSAKVRDQIKASATGATVRHTAPDRIYAVQVSLPPLTVQRKIAAILSAYDDLIENNTRRIKILEEMAQTIYNEWFVQFRFLDHENTEIIQTPRGPMPKEWKIKKVGNLGKIVIGKTPSKADPENFGNYMPFIRIPDMRDSMFCTKTNEMLSRIGVESQRKKTLPPNSICISCIGTAGIVSITSVPSQTNQQINSVILNDVKEREFLYFALKALRQTIELHGATGATMTNVSKGKLMNLDILYPKKELISEYNKIVAPMFDEIRLLQEKNELLKQMRDLLLPKLISGEINVSEIDIGGFK